MELLVEGTAPRYGAGLRCAPSTAGGRRWGPGAGRAERPARTHEGPRGITFPRGPYRSLAVSRPGCVRCRHVRRPVSRFLLPPRAVGVSGAPWLAGLSAGASDLSAVPVGPNSPAGPPDAEASLRSSRRIALKTATRLPWTHRTAGYRRVASLSGFLRGSVTERRYEGGPKQSVGGALRGIRSRSAARARRRIVSRPPAGTRPGRPPPAHPPPPRRPGPRRGSAPWTSRPSPGCRTGRWRRNSAGRWPR